MWIQVRTIDGKETRTVEDLSRLTKIESLRLKIQDIFNVSPQQQRLFYRGKQVIKRGKVKRRLCHPPPLCNSRIFLARALFFVRCERGPSRLFCSRVWPVRASCFDRNPPLLLVQELWGAWWASQPANQPASQPACLASALLAGWRAARVGWMDRCGRKDDEMKGRN